MGTDSRAGVVRYGPPISAVGLGLIMATGRKRRVAAWSGWDCVWASFFVNLSVGGFRRD